MSSPRHLIIAGPTASGKSALALRLARARDAAIVNADAMQVYACWRILSARPSDADLAAAPHLLYGHVGRRDAYSVGHWLRQVQALLDQGRPLVFVGGTGLYLSALTEGLAPVPDIPPEIRHRGNELRQAYGAEGFLAELAQADPKALARIDRQNPVRLQRAWEVVRATGRPLADFHAGAAPPLLPAGSFDGMVLQVAPSALRDRIAARFHAMMDAGALGEVRAVMADGWDASLPASRAHGAPELAGYLRGERTLDDAIARGILNTQQYAKRQRTWFRNRMADWLRVTPDGSPA
jgi:tRNA dimethylallyltransferase